MLDRFDRFKSRANIYLCVKQLQQQHNRTILTKLSRLQYSTIHVCLAFSADEIGIIPANLIAVTQLDMLLTDHRTIHGKPSVASDRALSIHNSIFLYSFASCSSSRSKMKGGMSSLVIGSFSPLACSVSVGVSMTVSISDTRLQLFLCKCRGIAGQQDTLIHLSNSQESSQKLTIRHNSTMRAKTTKCPKVLHWCWSQV